MLHELSKPTLRNDGTSLWLKGLENEAESLGAPMQIADYSRAVACLVGRGPGVDVLRPVQISGPALRTSLRLSRRSHHHYDPLGPSQR